MQLILKAKIRPITLSNKKEEVIDKITQAATNSSSTEDALDKMEKACAKTYKNKQPELILNKKYYRD